MSLLDEKAEVLPVPDFSDAATYADEVPHSAFAAVRERPGLHWIPTKLANENGGIWAVTRFSDIVEIEKDPDAFTSTKGPAFPLTNMGPDNPAADMIMCTDPPRHNYLRRAAAKGFAPRIVSNFEPWIREVVTEVIDGVEGKSEFDYIDEFARTIPAYVVARVLGSPREDREWMIRVVTEHFEAEQDVDGLDDGASGFDSAVPIIEQLTDYARKMQQQKLAEPEDDMFTELARCVERGEINQDEYLQWMWVMMAAGYETTHTMIAQSMRMYLQDPEAAEAIDSAVKSGQTERMVAELLRYITPVYQMARTATRDLTFAGEQIRKNDVMVLYYVAANRDPAVFSEPDRFNPSRSETDSLAFGSGVHRCIGYHLAKLELQILWEELHKRGVKLELAGEPKRGWSNYINLLTELPVRRA
ncbi:cytochrome P450 [Nocardia sp. NPDC050713]|uniref:cytochrome P450 n=1 Tax=Nocardia sp. NPDC050713 TaxID=3154511 RepID=UPI00340583DB